MINAIIIRLWIDLINILFEGYNNKKYWVTLPIFINKFKVDNALNTLPPRFYILFTELLFNQFGKERKDKAFLVKEENGHFRLEFDEPRINPFSETVIAKMHRKDLHKTYQGNYHLIYLANALNDLLKHSFMVYHNAISIQIEYFKMIESNIKKTN